MNEDFIKAFNYTMKFEIGPQCNPEDPDVIAGNIATATQRKKVGFTDVPGDRGGVTKYGIAQNAHPKVSVKDLTLDQAMKIYEKQYWFAGKCDVLPGLIARLHFDACVNHGLKPATRFLQRALGTKDDAIFGPETTALANAADITKLAHGMLDARETFFHRIVENDSTQKKFLKGWLARITHLRSCL